VARPEKYFVAASSVQERVAVIDTGSVDPANVSHFQPR